MSNVNTSILSAEDVLSQSCTNDKSGDQSSRTSFIDTDDESQDEYEPEGDFVNMNGSQLLIDPNLLMNSVDGDNFSQVVPLPMKTVKVCKCIL